MWPSLWSQLDRHSEIPFRAGGATLPRELRRGKTSAGGVLMVGKAIQLLSASLL